MITITPRVVNEIYNAMNSANLDVSRDTVARVLVLYADHVNISTDEHRKSIIIENARAVTQAFRDKDETMLVYTLRSLSEGFSKVEPEDVVP